MSHFTEMKSNALVKHEADLIAELKAMFGEDGVEVHDEAQKLQGYDGRAGKKANIIIRKDKVKKAFGTYGWNDIGFERQDGGYAMHYDPTDLPEEKRQQIMKGYTDRVATRKLKSQGYSVKRTVTETGHIVLKAWKAE